MYLSLIDVMYVSCLYFVYFICLCSPFLEENKISNLIFKPLLKGSEIISSVDLKGLPDEFTKELLKKNLDFLIPNQNSDKIDIVDISEYRQYHQGYEYLDKSSKSTGRKHTGL